MIDGIRAAATNFEWWVWPMNKANCGSAMHFVAHAMLMA
jgi:hypothetical protein